jgi:acetyl esterase/lipase
MVHGGAWAAGDKGGAAVARRVARWVPRGVIVVSTNYRLLPDVDPIEQANDVARALAAAQDKAESVGGDRGKFVVIGHSAGAHLVMLLTASPAVAAAHGVAPWRGTVALDTAALDVVGLMEAPHPRLYDRAFGRDRAYWKSASPFHVLESGGPPFLAVCSARRADSCAQAFRLSAKAASLGRRGEVHKEDLSHGELNERLGEDGAYTEAVEAFLRSVEPAFAPDPPRPRPANGSSDRPRSVE